MAGVNHIISYGQSLSVGVGTAEVISTTQRYSNQMFVGGVRSQDAGTDPFDKYGSLVPMVEQIGPVVSGGQGFETPVSGMAEMLGELGIQSRFLGSCPGAGGLTISALSKGGIFYERLISDVTYGLSLAARANRTYKFLAFAWMQGEADGANATYASAFNTLRSNLNDDVKAITQQDEDLWCLSYQLPRAKIGLAHLAAQETYDNIVVAMPIYHLPTTDGVHLTAESSKIAGAYFGLAYDHIVVDGDVDWRPLMVISARVDGANIDLTYNVPAGDLSFDSTIVAPQTNNGFTLVDAGADPLTISSISITGPNTIRIVAAETVPSGAKVYYGFTDPENTSYGTDKGNLRDTQGETIVFDGGGINYPMHNWAVLQQIDLP